LVVFGAATALMPTSITVALGFNHDACNELRRGLVSEQVFFWAVFENGTYLHESRAANRRDDNVCVLAHGSYVQCSTVRNSDSGIALHKQECERHADNVGASDDHCTCPGYLHATAVQQFDAALQCRERLS
jgi:hypothetical protein